MGYKFFIKTSGGNAANNLAKIFRIVKKVEKGQRDVDSTKDNSSYYQLPENTVPSINGRKIIAMSQIVDGVAVFERVARLPYKVSLDFTVYEKNSSANYLIGKAVPGAFVDQYVFPMQTIQDVMAAAWQPNESIKIENILLNNLGIMELMIEEVNIEPVLGSVNVNVSIRGMENYYNQLSSGTSLTIK